MVKKNLKMTLIVIIVIGWLGGAPPPAGSVPKYSGDMPNDDVMDDPNAAESQPTAPPMEKMDQIGGYSNVGFNASKCFKRAKKQKQNKKLAVLKGGSLYPIPHPFLCRL